MLIMPKVAGRANQDRAHVFPSLPVRGNFTQGESVTGACGGSFEATNALRTRPDTATSLDRYVSRIQCKAIDITMNNSMNYNVTKSVSFISRTCL